MGDRDAKNWNSEDYLLFFLQCVTVLTGERRNCWIQEKASVSLILLHHIQVKYTQCA